MVSKGEGHCFYWEIVQKVCGTFFWGGEVQTWIIILVPSKVDENVLSWRQENAFQRPLCIT